MDTREFNRLMKYAFMNDDKGGVLNSIYDSEFPHPYFNPKNIAFRKLRTFDHNCWTVRENSERIIVFEDMEYIIPGEKFIWEAAGSPPCIEQDYLITSSITKNDHLWPCPYAFSSWHLAQTSMMNKDIFVKQKDQRPFFADILLGYSKKHRQIFFDLLKGNNNLEDNLVSFFKQYKTPYIDQGTGEIDIFFRELTDKSNQTLNTTEKFNGKSFASQYISNHIQEATWISVVAETLHDNRIFFPTEKTAKAMLSNKPFIVLSGQHFLKNLRSIGFKTFHPIIDESYDGIDDLTERTKSAFNSFLELQKHDQKMVRLHLKDVLDHNERCMRDKSWLTKRARAMLDPLATIV